MTSSDVMSGLGGLVLDAPSSIGEVHNEIKRVEQGMVPGLYIKDCTKGGFLSCKPCLMTPVWGIERMTEKVGIVLCYRHKREY